MKSATNKKKDERHADSFSTSQAENVSASLYHTPVLLFEAVDALNIKPDGVYVDCTYGGGGHSEQILKRLNSAGRLYVFDQDADAGSNIPEDDGRLIFIQQNFRYLQRFLRLQNVSQVDGILADLGVSSHQFDEGSRGFSTRFDGDLDMRMNQSSPIKAFEIVQKYSEHKLHKLFEKYGEVTNAKTLARKILAVRDAFSLKTTNGFKNAVSDVVKGNPNKYFAQVFQALRIEVNDEMQALKEMLQQSSDLLAVGGRIAVITFHSIEDRLVKHFFKEESFEEKVENPFINTKKEKRFDIITRKPIEATEKEIKQNPRARSAKLRVAERR